MRYRPFIRRVIMPLRDLVRSEYISPRWARRIWREWHRGFQVYDTSSMWEQPHRVCPFCFFLWRSREHPDELQRRKSAHAAAVLKSCRCLKLRRAHEGHGAHDHPGSSD